MATAEPTPAAPRRAWVEQVMGMPVSIHLRGPRAGSGEAARRVAQVYRELASVDMVFSTYRPRSPVSLVAAGELALADAGAGVQEVAALCELARERTDGAFDAWLPGADPQQRRFDPSGLVKGWAAERAAARLDELDGVDHYLNAGGDIALAADLAAARPPWRIGIEDPRDPANLVSVLELAAGGVATSGTAHRGGHVLDPATGRPAESLRSVTVTGPSLMWADVYATAALVRGEAALDWLETLEGYAGLLVSSDGVQATTGWAGEVPPD